MGQPVNDRALLVFERAGRSTDFVFDCLDSSLEGRGVACGRYIVPIDKPLPEGISKTPTLIIYKKGEEVYRDEFKGGPGSAMFRSISYLLNNFPNVEK